MVETSRAVLARKKPAGRRRSQYQIPFLFKYTISSNDRSTTGV